MQNNTYSFIRKFYDNLSDMSDAEIEAHLLKNDLFQSAEQYLSYVKKESLIPEGFNSIDYKMANGDLRKITDEWRLVKHFIEMHEIEDRSYKRDFDPIFYEALYFKQSGVLSENAIRMHWTENRENFANVHEVLSTSGFSSSYWLEKFDAQSYLVSNSLLENILTSTDAIVHFVTFGVQNILPISEKLRFDVDFYKSWKINVDLSISDADLYRDWLQNGLLNGDPPNETEFVESLGLSSAVVPSDFDSLLYIAHRSDLLVLCQDKWRAFEHFVKFGVHENSFIPVRNPISAAILLRDIGDRHARSSDLDVASRIYERAMLFNPSDTQLLQHVADLALRQRNFPRALLFYRDVRKGGQPSYWTLLNGGNAALEAGHYHETIEWCEQGLHKYPRAHTFITLRDRAFDRWLNDVINDHIAACRQGHFDGLALEKEVRNIFDKILTSEQTRYAQVPEIKPNLSSRPASFPLDLFGLRIIMLANEDLPQCTHYRVRQKDYQSGMGRFEFRSFQREDIISFIDGCADADVAIFYRIAVNIGTLRCLANCRRIGIPTFYEIDDFVFSSDNFPDSLPSYGGAITADQHFELQCGVGLVAAFAGLCDYGIASTNALVTNLELIVRKKRALLHRNGLTPELALLADGYSKNGISRRRSELVIFYGSGTKAHSIDFTTLLEPALIYLMNRYPELKLCTCGYVPVQELQRLFPNRVIAVGIIAEFTSFVALMSNCDINIAILQPSSFNDCKSEIKWLEAAAVGIPTVASNVQGFRDTLTDGYDILLCDAEAASWIEKLELLITRPAMRARIGKQAALTATTLYAPQVLGLSLSKSIFDIIKLTSADSVVEAARPPKSKLLLVNVFASPQSIGGATRIFDGQVQTLAKRHIDEFEVAVCCGNDDYGIPYTVELYTNLDGVKTYSINTPAREFMDWIHNDERIGPVFSRIVDSFQPDIIHFHCIQRLTSTVAKISKNKKIPYFITIHDAWWISDHQFLMDANDRPVTPSNWPAITEVNPHTLIESTTRRMELASILRSAVQILPVSEAFTQLHKICGFENVTTISNGIGPLPALTQQRPKSNHVVLGHVGGISYHKGYFLFRKAILEARPSNISVVVVDHAMREGETRLERWGEVIATFIGKIPQAQVQELYGCLDVLVAPSMWPESFGLVTREAQHYRKWIIASNRGAIGESVVMGENGFLIDVSDTTELVKVLKTIDDCPETYKSLITKAVKQRTIAEQTLDYIGLYRKLRN